MLLDGELLLRLRGPVARTAGLATRRMGGPMVGARSRNCSDHLSSHSGRAVAPQWQQGGDSFHKTEKRVVGHGAEPFLSGRVGMRGRGGGGTDDHGSSFVRRAEADRVTTMQLDHLRRQRVAGTRKSPG